MTTESSTPGATSRRGVAPMALPDRRRGGTGCEDDAPVGNSGGGLNFGDQLKIATWNCGGLTKTQLDFCKEYDYDILALTDTHDNNSIQIHHNFVKSEHTHPVTVWPG